MTLAGGSRRDAREALVERDGYARRRYRGQPRRGHPAQETEDRLDARLALVELQDACQLYSQAAIERRDSRKRRELAASALAKLELAGRLIEAVIERRLAALL